ncbi:hypothetical protein [Neisseria sicca]|uniref:hypothetical protein n=1 Tax=Neisseria sicca TaxID=490 RepID=UPI001649ECCD|nr:hypothetical protein [Neisseria sicca]
MWTNTTKSATSSPTSRRTPSYKTQRSSETAKSAFRRPFSHFQTTFKKAPSS